ncbi:MAG: hypothetical protein ACREPA_09930, partial [Candidatus Dormibacteraceae bacterium]
AELAHDLLQSVLPALHFGSSLPSRAMMEPHIRWTSSRGSGHTLTIPVAYDHAATDLSSVGGDVSLSQVPDHNQSWGQATGRLSVDASGVAGSLDVSLTRDTQGAAPLLISGRWACGHPAPPPVYDATVSCSLTYALAGLSADAVARLQSAHACLAQDLTLAGGLVFHVDHALNDPTRPPAIGQSPPVNACGVQVDSYLASVYFSSGDETFLLSIVRAQDPILDGPFAPGSFPALYMNDVIGQPAPAVNLNLAQPAADGSLGTDQGPAWEATGGTFTVAPDLRSGTVNADLKGGVSGAETVHLAGAWRCAA